MIGLLVAVGCGEAVGVLLEVILGIRVIVFDKVGVNLSRIEAEQPDKNIRSSNGNGRTKTLTINRNFR
jgi:hypothetical protein